MAQPSGQDVRFQRLYAEHRDAIVAYCTRRVSRDDALDAAAETFAVAWRRIEDVPRGEAELSWLYAVAYRVCANERRGEQRLGALRTKLSGTAPDPTPDPGHQVVRFEEHRRLIDALGTLKPTDQELLRLVTWEEHPRDQVARILGITRSTLDQRLHRAVIRLRKVYGQLESRPLAPKAAEGGAR